MKNNETIQDIVREMRELGGKNSLMWSPQKYLNAFADRIEAAANETITELNTAKAFYRVAVAERDAERYAVDALRAENTRLRAALKPVLNCDIAKFGDSVLYADIAKAVREAQSIYNESNNGESHKKKESKKMETMTINGEEWVKKSSIPKSECAMAAKVDGLPYKMVRTYSAGVFAGYVESLDGQHAVLRNARRIWYWDGAASLSELAMRGTSKPENCKFPRAVDRVELTQVIELIDITDAAAKSIAEVKEWTMQK